MIFELRREVIHTKLIASIIKVPLKSKHWSQNILQYVKK